MFGNIGLPEMVVIMAIALLVFGPKKLPEIGRSIGKALREFKKATEEIKDKFEEQINAEEFKDIKNDLADIKKEVSGTLELQNEIKDLTRDLNAPPAATTPPVPQVEPAPAEPPAPQDAAKDGPMHGEG